MHLLLVTPYLGSEPAHMGDGVSLTIHNVGKSVFQTQLPEI